MTDPTPEGPTMRTLDLDTITLGKGSHPAPSDAPHGGDLCVMEAVAWIAGEPWSDSPSCASEVIGAFLRSWNDTLPDDDRQDLKRYIPRLVGSAGTPEQEDARAWMSLDWLVRTYTPAWLRLAGLVEQADTLAGLPEFRAGVDVSSIRKDATAARAAAGGAARDAAWDAAWTAAGAAAWAAVEAAAWAAVEAAAEAAGAAARAAARAAGDALRPTVVELQESAHGLVDRMLAVTEHAR